MPPLFISLTFISRTIVRGIRGFVAAYCSLLTAYFFPHSLMLFLTSSS
jgi:hypothetical protein